MSRIHYLSRPFLVLLALGCLATAAPAADKWPVPLGPSHEPNPFHYDSKLWQEVPKKYIDDAAACILYASSTYLVEPDGTIETIVHDVTRLNGRKGVEKLGEYRNIAYDPSYETLTLNTAVIHKADGRDVPVEARDVQLRDVATDYQVYDHQKQLIISFPHLEVGDVFEVKWTIRGKNPEYAGRFFTRYAFGDVTYPCVTDELRVRVPKAMPFKYASFIGKIDPIRTEDKDQVLYLWKSVHNERLPQDENMPSKEDLRAGVACSTFPSWQAVGKWKMALRKESWVCSTDVQETAKDAIKGLSDPIAKSRALVYWMRRNIRYVSAGETHDFTPHRPSEILANRYGDCKDTSQLLAVMLREAGVKVELATLGARDDGQVIEAVPSPWGTHAILVATIDGKEHWIDTTSSLAGWDFLPHDDHDRLCYVVDDKGALRLMRTPPLTADDNRIVQSTNVYVAPDGSSRCERDATAFGQAALVERDAYLETPVGEQRRQVTAELQDANSKARLIHLNIDEASLRDFDSPVKAHVVFSIGDQFTGDADKEGSVSDSKVWGKLLAYNLDYDRQTPMEFYSPFESRHRYVVHLPPEFTLDGPPADETVRSTWGEFSRKVAIGDDDRTISVEFVTRLNKVRVEPAGFEAFRKFHDEVNRYYRVWLTLKPTRDLADAPMLEGLLALAPDDADAAATLARIYHISGKDGDARRVLRRTLAYHPGDQALLEMNVKTAETVKQETNAQRELVGRFPEEERYVIELGSLLVDQGLHDEARTVLAPATSHGTAAHRAQAYYQLARDKYRTDQLEPAMLNLRRAEKIDPTAVSLVQTGLLKGLIFEDLKLPDDAALAFEMVLTQDQNSTKALDALIRLKLAGSKPAEALPYLRRYVVAVGDDIQGLLKAADYSLRMNRWDDAFDLASRSQSQRILGLVYLHRGEYAQAAKHLEKASPDAEVLDGLVRSNLALGALREAAYQAEKAGALNKRGPELSADIERVHRLLLRREALAKLPSPAGKEAEWAAALDRVVCAEDFSEEGGSPDDVIARLASIFAKGLEMGPAFALRARAEFGKGRLTAALADAERAVKLSPREASGYYVRGLVHMERTDLPGALADLEKARKLTAAPNAEVLHAWASVLHSSGRLTEALDAQQKAVKLKPKNKEMLDQLRRFEKEAGRTGPG
jgi:tetratricopeptide (TPR) repeat protein